MKKKTTKVHVVSYTHWDREFRWEFERTRMRLVDCLDHLLEIMEKHPEYASFLLDGQATLLDDYLEIRPEKIPAVKKLAAAGRLEIGPWYTLADCAPIMGESVIRNILCGTRKSADYGRVLKCGYNVFSFGQIAQLPQIYANFGIDCIIFYKHMDPKKSKYHEFVWEAPDGTRALASRLGPEARWNYFFAGHIPLAYDKDAWHKDWQYKWGELGKIFHTAGPREYGWFYDILDPETMFHRKNIRMAVERTLKTVEGTAAPESVLFFDGTDFTEPHPMTVEMIQTMNKEFKGEVEIVHSTLDAYLRELKRSLAGRKDLDIVKGPMRDGPVGAIHTDVYSIHPEIMIANSHAENSIVRWAEPLAAFSWALGIEQYPATYLDKIWKLMFQSHSHDSMHGLGPKTLVDGQVARIEQAHVIAQGLERRGVQNITKEIDTSAEKGDFFINVFNPSSFKRSEVVEAFIDIPKDVRLDTPVIEDISGRKVQIQEVERLETRSGVYHPRSRNMPFYCTKVHLFFLAEDVPALGYKTFRIKWTEKKEYPYPHEDFVAPRTCPENLLKGPVAAENEFFKVSVNHNGTFNVTDKATGQVYENLNYFLDGGDTGNMWVSYPPENDRIISSLSAPAEVSAGINGPLAASFLIKQKLRVPAEFDWNRKQRSAAETSIAIEVKLTLRKGCPFLEVETSLDNTARDHYLKVCFPTGLKAEKTWSEGSFSVAEFPVKSSESPSTLARHPAQLWFDISDGQKGLAVLSDAAKDYEVLEHSDNGTLAMGLVRGVRLRIPCDNRLWMEYPGDESSQSLRKFTYRYALMPHKNLWDDTDIYRHSLAFNTPLRPCQFGRQKGSLPLEKSFIEISGDNIILSSIKKAEGRDSIIVRLFNPTAKNADCSVTANFNFSCAHIVNMDETKIAKLATPRRRVNLIIPKGKITTIEYVFLSPEP